MKFKKLNDQKEFKLFSEICNATSNLVCSQRDEAAAEDVSVELSVATAAVDIQVNVDDLLPPADTMPQPDPAASRLPSTVSTRSANDDLPCQETEDDLTASYLTTPQPDAMPQPVPSASGVNMVCFRAPDSKKSSLEEETAVHHREQGQGGTSFQIKDKSPDEKLKIPKTCGKPGNKTER